MTSQLDMFGRAETAAPVRSRARAAAKAVSRQTATPSHDDMAALLEQTGNYRVLRRLPQAEAMEAPRPEFARVAIIVDTETTGLKKSEDEVIEIGAVAFSFTENGEIGDIVGTFGALQQPSRPIPPEITKLTGITDEMVEGQSIPMAELEAFVSRGDLIIAHNAAFDRPFCERLSPVFANKPWCCSNNEVDWRLRGFEGTKLGYLLSQSGMFHDGHRAVDDCYALLEVLRSDRAGASQPFAELLEASRLERVRLWAEYSPFDRKDDLKARGYRWSSGEGQQPKAWWTEVDAEALDAELEYLKTEIYGRADFEVTTRSLTALNRFRI